MLTTFLRNLLKLEHLLVIAMAKQAINPINAISEKTIE